MGDTFQSTNHTQLKMQSLILIAALVGSAICSPQFGPLSNTVDNFQEPYQLSSGAFDIFGNVDSRFSCEGRIYGFYANEELNCQIFHVCEPVTYPDGRQETVQYNFFCPLETVFDQSLLVCNHAVDAIPCSDSSAYLFKNEEFGIIPRRNDVLRVIPRQN